MEEVDVIKVLLNTLETLGLWFTTKSDPTYEEPKSYYKLDEYGDPTEETAKKIEKEILDYIGDGAVYLEDAIEMWIYNAIQESKVAYKEMLMTNFKEKQVVDNIEAYEVNKKLTESLDNSQIIDELNSLCSKYSPYSDDKDEIQQQVEKILTDAPNGTEMYRVSKDTSSDWTSYGSYSDERTVLKPFIKENDVWTMYGKKRTDIHDAMLSVLYNSGKFMTKEQAEKEKEEQSVNDKTYHRDIVNVGKDNAGNDAGSSTNRVEYPNRKTESSDDWNGKYYFIDVDKNGRHSYISTDNYMKNQGETEWHSLSDTTDAWEVKEYGYKSEDEAKRAISRLKNYYKRLDIKYDSMKVVSTTLKETKTESRKTRLKEENNKSLNLISQKIQDPKFDSDSKDGKIVLRTQELFNVLSDKGYDVQVAFDNGESQSSIMLGQQGGQVNITITNDNQPLRAFLSGSVEVNEENIETLTDISKEISVL